MNAKEFILELNNGTFDKKLIELYGKDALDIQKKRYEMAADKFEKLYSDKSDISIFSAPGRTEICGNHTDHQHGCVLAAAVNLDAIAVVTFNKDHVIRLQSAGYSEEYINLTDLSIHPEEKGTTAALLRGMAAKFHEIGVNIGGFNAYVTSEVLGGSGLSSSASFEVLIGTIIDKHYNEGKAGPVNIAKMGQFTENQYFGKQSGLMDQTVSSVGGFVYIDFENTTNPVIEKHTCDFEKEGLNLFITDTKGSHAFLTDDYISVPSEMNTVAAQFGKKHLREVPESDFYEQLPRLRQSCTDRAILRAAHYYGDNARVSKEVEALDQKDISRFLELVNESGNSSARWLQNLYSTRKPSEQGITLGLMVSERVLGKKGACRVHGGGFAGTIQAFVPDEIADSYRNAMDSLFGEGSCYKLKIREVGGTQVI